jgi:hypothetical protein
VSQTDCLSIARLREILSSSSLRIEGEDWVYEYVMRQNREFCEVFSRLEFIRFEYLSGSRIRGFIEFVSGSLTDINLSLFQRLKTRLNCRIQMPIVGSLFEPSAPLDGIIAHLTRECRGNVDDHKIVSITSSDNLLTSLLCYASRV